MVDPAPVVRLRRRPARLAVTLAGDLSVTYGDTRVGGTDFRGRQARQAFAYLALHPRPVPRDELAEALWPGPLPSAWEADLSAVVSRVRAALARLPAAAGIAVASRAGGYELELGADGAVDVAAAVEALATARVADAAGDGEGALLAAATAVTLLRPPLLADLDAPWLDDWRDERRRTLVDALELVAAGRLAAGDPAGSAAAAREAVSVEPYRERAHAALLRAHLAAGNRAEVLRAYDVVRTLLTGELGVEPSAEIEALREQARRPAAGAPGFATDPAPAEGRDVVAVPPSIPARDECPVFVGRAAELGALEAGVAATAGGARLLVVEGEPGIGKSCLVGELARRMGPGALVLAGRCDEYSTAPYLAVADAIGQWAAAVDDASLHALAAGDAVALARLLPELGPRLGVAAGAVATSDPAADRHRLYAAVTALLDRCAARLPVVLAVDDIQWADAGSVQLLRHLVLTCGPRVCLVATYRTADPAPAGGLLTDVLAELRSRDRVERVRLGGLDAPAVAALLAEVEAGAPALHWASALCDAAGGNPLFVREIVRHLAGVPLPDPAANPSASDLISLAGIPATIDELLARRLGRLAPAARDALHAAAVAGVEFDLGLVACVSGLDEADALGALEEAVAAGLVSETAERPDGYRFTHPLVAGMLARSLSGARRARLHHRAGVGLAARGERVPPGEVARHLVAAGPLADAAVVATYTERAGRSALAMFAYEEAAARFGDGLCALDQLTPGGNTDRRRLDLLLALADARTRAGDTSGARAPTEEALDVARAIGAPDSFARAALTCGSLLVDEGVEGGAVNDAFVAVLDEALAGYTAMPSPSPVRARLLARRSVELQFGTAADQRTADAIAAEAEARAAGDPDAVIAALSARYYDLLGSPCVAERLVLSVEIDALGQRVADAALPNPRVARDYLELGDLPSMRAALAAFEARAKALGLASWLWLPAMWSATLAVLEGRLDEAEALSQRARDLGRQVRGPDAADAVHAAQLFGLYLAQGRLGELAPVVAVFPETQPHRPVWRAAAAWAWAEGGELGRSEAMLAPLADAGWHTLTVNVDLPVTLALAAWTAGALGASEWARVLYERLLPYRDLCVVAGVWPAMCSGSAAHPLAVAAATAGLADEAIAAFDRARAMNERVGAAPWLARVERDQALAFRAS